MTDAVFDPGLQPERTLLAWRRTCLSFGLASLVAMRFTAESLGLAAVIVGLVGAGLAVGAYFAAAIGYRRAHVSLHRSGALERGAWPLALATAAALMLGAACAGYLLMGALGS
ncbi:DUF202 domain-containing protein [Microbacterium sp. KNMS]